MVHKDQKLSAINYGQSQRDTLIWFDEMCKLFLNSLPTEKKSFLFVTIGRRSKRKTECFALSEQFKLSRKPFYPLNSLFWRIQRFNEWLYDSQYVKFWVSFGVFWNLYFFFTLLHNCLILLRYYFSPLYYVIVRQVM